MSADLTSFAGLERLDPGDALDSAFLRTNITVIDRLLQVGAVTHRHDGRAAVADPTVPPGLTTADTGGTIPADLSMSVGYTWVDDRGGETLMSPAQVITTVAGLTEPTGVPTAVVDASAGTLSAHTYYYAVTILDGAGGETTIGPSVAVTVDPGNANAQIHLSGLAALITASGGTDWRLWRAVDSSIWYSMGTGRSDTFTDDGSHCADCSIAPPSVGTTRSTSTIEVLVAGPAPANVVTFNIYASIDGAFTSPALLGNYPIADLGTTKTYTEYAPLNGSPPEVSLSLPGANKIDPDTELIDWHWKRPVATVADLPATGNGNGDVRVVTATSTFYSWDGTAWNAIGTGGGGGGSSTPTYALGTEVQWTDDAGAVRARITGENAYTYPASSTRDDFTTGGNANLGGGYQRDISGTGTLYNNDTGGDNYIYLDPAAADAVQLSRAFAILSDTNWDHIGLTIGGGGLGLFAFIDRATTELQIAVRTAIGAYTVIASAGAAQGVTLPVSGAHTYELDFTKEGHHLTALLYETTGGTYTQIGPTLTADIPTAMRAAYGEGNALHYGFADGASGGTDAWNSDHLDHLVATTTVKQVRVNVVDPLGNQVDRVLLDENGRLDMPSIASGETFDDTTKATLGTNWTVPGSGALPGGFLDLSRLIHLSGRFVKTGGTAPADGEVIATILDSTLWGSAWNSELEFVVTTGDSDGRQIGMVSLAQNAGATGVEIRWRGGKSTDPTTKHPYVMLDGIVYR